MEIKNLKQAADRIKRAIEDKENIVLYGDADLDGVTSIIVLKEAIKNLGGKIVAVYFPDREKEGYGINKRALHSLKEKAPALMIAADCGISNFEEIKIAKELGFDVIVIDHHQVLDKLPKADIIVDPKQEADESGFEYLATVGIMYKLAMILFSGKIPERIRENFLELVALGTVADMMPRKEDNKAMIEEGLYHLEDTWRPGLEAFLGHKILKEQENVSGKVSKIISLLNIRDLEDQLPASYRLLTASSKEQALEILERLINKDSQRRIRKEEIKEEIEQKISNIEELIIFEGDPSWDIILLGSIASIISRKYQKPTFLFKNDKEKTQGTARSSSDDDDLVAAMKSCSNLLETFGGHAKAAGFRLKSENIEKFKQCLIKYFKR
jgi:single-stranded-DNA-specific exonuclease